MAQGWVLLVAHHEGGVWSTGPLVFLEMWESLGSHGAPFKACIASRKNWVLFMLNSLYIVPAKSHGHKKNEHSDAPRGQSPCPLPKSILSTPIHLVQRPI